MAAQDLHARLDQLALQLDAAEQELATLRGLVTAQQEPEPQRQPQPPQWSVPPVRPARPTAPPAPAQKAVPQPPRRSLADFDFAAWLGARGLAWSGGAVTVLGVVFFFVLAVDRGWVGPLERVGLGALASTVLFAAGVLAHRRYGDTYAALSAAGAGIAGAYATLLFAAARYDLVPDLAALAIATAIAAIATVTAVSWASETVAGLGLVGAILVPCATLADDPHELTTLGTAFAAIVFAASAATALRQGWRSLLAIAGALGAAQVALLVAQTDGAPGDVVVLTTVAWLLFLVVAAAAQRERPRALDRLPAAFVTGSTALAGLSAAHLFDGDLRGVDSQGLALLAIASVELVAAGVLYGRRLLPELGALLGVAGLAVGAVACGDLLAGATLASAWAAEAAVLSWLAPRVRDARLQLASLAFLIAAAAHALVIDAPLRQLYVAGADPASGVLAVVAVAAATAVFAAFGRPLPDEGNQRYPGLLAFLEGAVSGLAGAYRERRIAALWVAATLSLYAAALTLLALFESDALRGGRTVGEAFDWGHVAVRGLLVTTALALVVAAATGWRRHLALGGHALLFVALAHIPRHDVEFLGPDERSWAFVLTAAGLLGVLLLDELRHPHDELVRELARWLSPAFAPLSLALVFAALLELVDGRVRGLQTEDLAALGAAGVYGALAALLFRKGRRAASTAMWASALVVAVVAASELLSGNTLVFALAATAAATVLLGRGVGERRLQAAAAALLGVALVHVLAFDAPLADFFRANSSPADGVPAIAYLAAAAAIFAATRFPDPGRAPTRLVDVVAWELDRRQRQWRRVASAGAAVLAVYGLSLSILGAFQWLDEASVATSFQRGHTAVSAVWGVIGLAALLAGLRRGSPGLRGAGFALFGLSLAKLFLHDLSALSSVTRAFSFLAVGAVLLLGGFLYQRLSTDDRGGEDGSLPAH